MLGVLVDPPVMDHLDRDGIEEMQLLPARPTRDDKARLFEQSRCFITPMRVMSTTCDSRSVSVRPSRSKRRSSRNRRVGCASALNTRTVVHTDHNMSLNSYMSSPEKKLKQGFISDQRSVRCDGALDRSTGNQAALNPKAFGLMVLPQLALAHGGPDGG